MIVASYQPGLANRIAAAAQILLAISVIAAALVLKPIAANAQAKAAIVGNHAAAVPQNWAAASDSKQVSLSAVLALRNTNELAQLEGDLQNRHSPNYHKWLTTDEFMTRFGPTGDQATAVANWLTSQGFSVTSTDLRMRRVNFTGSVATVRQSSPTRRSG